MRRRLAKKSALKVSPVPCFLLRETYRLEAEHWTQIRSSPQPRQHPAKVPSDLPQSRFVEGHLAHYGSDAEFLQVERGNKTAVEFSQGRREIQEPRQGFQTKHRRID